MNEIQFSFLALWLTAQTALIGLCVWRLGIVLDELARIKADLYKMGKRL